ncbi:unnamed protein product [Cuscuta campestris]|uniref:Uncharacterized protein n=1 Tax=Cuscuta campestris TaxID=132261 RepID=A0A484MBK1_9ASTE|nr:unnamed protein product [Cuscuta campestris]
MTTPPLQAFNVEDPYVDKVHHSLCSAVGTRLLSWVVHSTIKSAKNDAQGLVACDLFIVSLEVVVELLDHVDNGENCLLHYPVPELGILLHPADVIDGPLGVPIFP